MKREHTYNSALLVLVAVNILNFYDRNVLGALTEPIRKEFALTDTQVGLIGSSFIWLYAIIGVPLGKIESQLALIGIVIGLRFHAKSLLQCRKSHRRCNPHVGASSANGRFTAAPDAIRNYGDRVLRPGRAQALDSAA